MIREVTVNGHPHGVFVPHDRAYLLARLIVRANRVTDLRWWWRRADIIPENARVLAYVGNATVMMGTRPNRT